MNVSTGGTLFVGGGGGGRDVSRRAQQRIIKRNLDLLGLAGAERDEVAEHLQRLYPGVFVDSDQWEVTELEPRFWGEEPEQLAPPVGYAPLDSPSGRYIAANVESLPFAHLGDWPLLPEIVNKSCDAEAEGNRLYGLANLIVNIGDVERRIAEGLDRLRSLPGGDVWQALVARGVPVSDKGFRVEVCVSLSGGQGTGAIIDLLGLIAEHTKDDRERFKVYLHLLFPGFFRAQNEEERRERRMKALSVLRDLAALKVGGAPLEIPRPGGKITLGPGETSELFSHLFVYEPHPAERNRYECFVTRSSESMVSAELSASASALKKARSNALELARLKFARKRIALVGA
jgi:hypothetical protein